MSCQWGKVEEEEEEEEGGLAATQLLGLVLPDHILHIGSVPMRIIHRQL